MSWPVDIINCTLHVLPGSGRPTIRYEPSSLYGNGPDWHLCEDGSLEPDRPYVESWTQDDILDALSYFAELDIRGTLHVVDQFNDHTLYNIAEDTDIWYITVLRDKDIVWGDPITYKREDLIDETT